jgi:MFS transporter, DHA2 family, multidrug resistance protein
VDQGALMSSSLFSWNRPKLHNIDSHVCRKFIIACVTIASMTIIMDLLSVVMVLTEIEGSFSIDSTYGFWLARSYMYMLVIAPLISYRLAKCYGFKLMFFVGNTLFIMSSIVCSLTTDYWVMLCFRIIAGFGGGIVLTVGMPIIHFTIMNDKLRRPIILAYNNVHFGFGIALGLIFGGYFGQIGYWQLVLHVNIFFTVIALIIGLFVLPETEKQPCAPYDKIGLTTIILCSLSLLIIVTQVKAPWNTMGWYSPLILSCGFIAVASLITFIVHSLQHDDPLFDVRLFTYRPFLIGSTALFLVSTMVFGVTMATLQMLQDYYGYERLKLGLFMSSLGIIYALLGLIPGITSKYINFRIWALLGVALLTYSCFISQTLTIQSDHYELGAVILLRAIGVSFSLGSLTVWALFCFDSEMYAKGTSIVTFMRQLGGVLGSGIIGMIADTRLPFHALRFGEQVNTQSARFMQYTQQLTNTLTTTKGSPPIESSKQTTELIITWIKAQAHISGILDAEYILGWFFLAMLILMAGSLVYVHGRKPIQLVTNYVSSSTLHFHKTNR